MWMRYGIILSLVILFLFSEAQDRIYTSSRINGELPDIDGILEEDVWNYVEWSGDFIQSRPYDGESPSQPTFFKILYDDDNIYIGVLAYDSVPGEIVRRITRRDGFDGDRVTVMIDSYYDKRTAFSFTVTAAGVKGDEYITDDGQEWDETWDPIWYADATVNDTGWTAEMKIPIFFVISHILRPNQV